MYGICLRIDGDIRSMDNDEFKRADKIYWMLNLVDTVLLIVLIAVIVVAIAK